MNRRQFLKGTAVAGATSLAGCTNALGSAGKAEMEWEYEWEGFVGVGFQPTIIVTGEIENVGEGYAELFELECQILADDGSMLNSRKRRLRHIEISEEQLFHWIFSLSEDEANQFDTVEVKGSFPDQ